MKLPKGNLNQKSFHQPSHLQKCSSRLPQLIGGGMFSDGNSKLVIGPLPNLWKSCTVSTSLLRLWMMLTKACWLCCTANVKFQKFCRSCTETARFQSRLLGLLKRKEALKLNMSWCPMVCSQNGAGYPAMKTVEFPSDGPGLSAPTKTPLGCVGGWMPTLQLCRWPVTKTLQWCCVSLLGSITRTMIGSSCVLGLATMPGSGAKVCVKLKVMMSWTHGIFNATTAPWSKVWFALNLQMLPACWFSPAEACRTRCSGLLMLQLVMSFLTFQGKCPGVFGTGKKIGRLTSAGPEGMPLISSWNTPDRCPSCCGWPKA